MRKLALLASILLLICCEQAQSAGYYRARVRAFQTVSDTNNEIEVRLVMPERIIKIGEGHYFIDFGKDAFGTVILLLRSPQKDPITIRLGEKLTGTNTIDKQPGGTIRYQEVTVENPPDNNAFRVKLQPDKRNSAPPAILLPDSIGVIMPFRYCEIENLKVPIEDLAIQQKVYNYRFNDQNSSFTCSDTILNKIWELGKYTIKATSFTGMYIDGDRERIPYEADAYINQLGHYVVDNEYSIARRTNAYFMNHPTWPTEWILHTVMLFYQDYMYTGDLAPLSKYYDALKVKTLIELEREDGLISSKSPRLTDEFIKRLGFQNSDQKLKDIVDWPSASSVGKGERDGYDMVDINTVVNAFHFHDLKLMAEIAKYLGKKDDAVFFSRRAELIKNSINDKLLNKEKGIYIDGEYSTHSSLHANMFPLAFDIVPGKYKRSVTEFIRSRGMACSVYGAQYLLEALYKQGESGYALELMTSTSDRSWWNMIRSGSTMTLEAWDLKYKSNLDWNHSWGTAPVNIVSRYLWGITPAKPGFAAVQIKPQINDLKFSKIKVPTIKGLIIAEFRQIRPGEETFEIKLPENMSGEFILPLNKRLKVNKNVRSKANNGKIILRPGLNKLMLE
jgi:alpha-L-rhamnosidase